MKSSYNTREPSPCVPREPSPCVPLCSFGIIGRLIFGIRTGVWGVSVRKRVLEWFKNKRKTSLSRTGQGDFLVAEEGLEPTTFGL